MGTRSYFYFFTFIYYLFYLFYFFTLPASAAINSQSNTVPTVFMSTAHQVLRHSLSNAPKTIITHEQMKIAGVTTLTQTLSDLAGVQLSDPSSNGSQAAISMRGFGANATSNTLVLINGIPITNPDIAPPDLNTIPINEITAIEIIAGSESVLYGDQAVGGVINIITHQDQADISLEKAAIACTIGSYNQQACYTSLSNHQSRLQYDIGFYLNHSDNFRDHNDYDQSTLSSHFDYPYQTGHLQLDLHFTKEEMQYPGALTANEVRENPRQASNHTDFFNDKNSLLHLKQEQSLRSDWRLETDFARRDMHGNGVLFSPFTQSRLSYFFKPELKGTIKQSIITSGFDLQKDSYHLNSAFGLTRNLQDKYGFFVLDHTPLTSRLAFSLGARIAQQNNHLETTDTQDNINRAFASTIGSSYQLFSTTQIYLRRAESFRFPKSDELASTPIGVTSLKTQRGVAYESGIEYEHDRYRDKIDIYQLNLRDEIAFDPTQTIQQPFGANRNLAKTVRRGFTLSEKNPLSENLTFNSQYHYIDARFQEGPNRDHRIPLVAANIVQAGIDYHLSDNWNLYTEALYTGNQYSANDDANLAGKIGGYMIYNFNLRYQLQQFSASFHINNIFDRFYYFYTVYEPSMQTEFFYPAPGRNFTLSMNYSFI